MKRFRLPEMRRRMACARGIWPAVGMSGFSLVEMLIAIVILTFGLLAAAQIIYSAVCSASLARCKGNIAVLAHAKLESLSDLYARDPGAVELTEGSHGPEFVPVVNPLTGVVLNRFSVTWQVNPVADPRPGRRLTARQIVVLVRPVDAANNANYKAYLNKAALVAGMFSPRD